MPQSPPTPSIKEQETRARHDLIDCAQTLIALDTPSLSPAEFHQWLHSLEELPLDSTDTESPSEVSQQK